MTSLMYQSAYVYDFFMRVVYRKFFEKRYKAVAEFIGKGKKVLDLGCGTCLLHRFLDKTCHYTGWDLNEKFLSLNSHLNVMKKNILDYKNYPETDVIVISDVLHHIFPNHTNLLKNAINKAKKVIVMEPHSIVKTTNNTLHKLAYKIFDSLLGDDDGINGFHDRLDWFKMKKQGVYSFFKSMNPVVIREVGPDYLAVFEKEN
ncbi:MAG: class I SAM-dependent methyltransferase [Candidatus Nanoarchaeia archaeon]|nr:class I SAM-dependent methyltransferase [Candidatus Nanoarchaeia archaeon]